MTATRFRYKPRTEPPEVTRARMEVAIELGIMCDTMGDQAFHDATVTELFGYLTDKGKEALRLIAEDEQSSLRHLQLATEEWCQMYFNDPNYRSKLK